MNVENWNNACLCDACRQGFEGIFEIPKNKHQITNKPQIPMTWTILIFAMLMKMSFSMIRIARFRVPRLGLVVEELFNL